MAESHPRFVDFIRAACAALGAPEPNVEDDSYLFQVEEQWIELRFDASAGEVIVAGLAFARGPDSSLRADLVGAFNVFHLFAGGYSLVASEETFVYLCQPVRLERLRPDRIRDMLVDFALRTEAAYAWYAEQVAQEPANSTEPPTAAGEGAAMRI